MSKNSQPASVASNPSQSVVVVLGMHRSGTSALTKALQVMGVSLSENLMPEGEFNPKGHWEDLSVVSINDRLLSQYHALWSSPTLVEVNFDSQRVSLLLAEAVSLVQQRVEEFGVWGFKDPRTSRLLPFWQEVFKRAGIDVKYVYALRNPLDIARSLKRRDGISHKHSFILWLMHTLPNLPLLQSDKVEFVTFSHLLAKPNEVLECLKSHLGLADLNKEKSTEFIQQFIDPSLSHSDANLVDLMDEHAHFEPIVSLYEILEKFASKQCLLSEWLKTEQCQRFLADYSTTIAQAQCELIEEFNIAAFEYRAQLFHANLRVQQWQDDSRNRQAELHNVIQTLQQDLIDKDQQLVAFNDKLTQQIQQTHQQEMLAEQQHILLEQHQQHIQALLAAITEIQHSTSWKITAPIRAVRPILSIPVRVFKRAVSLVRYHGGVKNTCRKAYRLYQRDGISALWRRGQYQVQQAVEQTAEPLIDYGQWLEKYGQLSSEQVQAVSSRIASLSERPKISVLMPVYNPPLDYLRQAIESVQAQLYPEWELCIADDASPNQAVRDLLREFAQQDSRIRVVEREQNGHISRATNSALALASGDFIALMDHDDRLANDALYWVAEAISANPQAALIYSDEDKLSADGLTRYDPNFKPQWNPELLRSQNCISHLGVYKTDVAKALGGFRAGFEGAQDWDFALRYSETLSPEQIIHIPRILYHWRAIEGSTAIDGDEKPYALTAGLQAVQEHCDRMNIQAQVVEHPERHYARVKYAIPTPQPMVSMIIPTRNGLDVLSVCIDSILAKTTYSNYEIIIVDNGSDCADTLAYLDKLQRENDNIVLLHDDSPFNYSALNNKAAAIAKGEILALVNNDVQVITPDWLTEMVGHAMQPQNGAVGARLWYPDDTLQHGGVILVGGVAGHAHKHLPKGMPGYACRAIVAQNYSAVTAACLVVRKAVFEQVGGLNETDLTVAFNDIDFCLKVQEAGYFNVWTPYAELYHYESKTRGFEDTPAKQARFGKEVAYMRNRWGHRLDADPCYNPNLTMAREDFSLAYQRRV
ncbi:glycosyltransferase [Vibrio metschnikovii]|uniref:glycosyltransferase n=1 Tax=Vibrio metschnikovii TaxID=28172 RepID=UPI002FCA140E|nr:glycosyltransferase [Vibrio metschnikovii]